MLVSRQNSFNSGGFTLIELMIVISILVVLAGFGVTSYRAWIENSKIRNAAESMLNGIQKARNFAVQNNTQVQFVRGSNTDWYICISTACPTALEQKVTSEGSSTSVTVTPTPAGTTVVFSNLGTRISGFTRLDFTTTELTAAERRPLAIIIKTGGAARLCDPAFSLPDPMGCT